MTPIAAPAPAPQTPPAPPKATGDDDRFAAMVDDGGTDAPAPSDTPVQDAAKPAPAAKPTPATAAPATAAATLAALIAAANGEAAPAPTPVGPTAPEAKPGDQTPADPKAAAKSGDKDAPQPAPAPAPALPAAVPMLATTPPPLAPPPHVTPAAKAAPKAGATVTTASDGKAVHATAPPDAPVPTHAKAETAPTTDFKAVLDGVATAPQTHIAAAATAPPDLPAVTVRPGQIGAETGIQIARQINAGENEFLLRLNPAEHGHIQIHMRFAEDGALRAVISADSATVLDMLRKDAGELTRTLGDAGVRTDAHSFRFDGQGQPDGGQRQPRGTPQGAGQGWNRSATDQPEDTPLARFRPLHGGLGVLDRLA